MAPDIGFLFHSTSPTIRESGVSWARTNAVCRYVRLDHSTRESYADKVGDGLQEPNRFDELVQALKDALGPCSGLTSRDIDVGYLTRLMERYSSDHREWLQFAFGDCSRGYTRNLIDEGNGKSNLLILVWTPGKGSPIHDHGQAHCLMKILRGSLVETRYEFPQDGEEKTMTVKAQTTIKENQVSYMADTLGVHRITNQGSDFAVSLHLYTPPNVAKTGCNIFDEMTGKQSHVDKCGYYSEYGRLVAK